MIGVSLAIMGLCCTATMGQPTAHYVPGVEGIKAATLPPPGLYLRDYNVFYTSTRLNDADGDKIRAADFSTFVYAQVPRLLWITDYQVVGGYLGFDALWPLAYQKVDVNTPFGRFDERSFGCGDPFVEATLSWHLPQWDLAVGIGEWIPIGAFDAPPTTRAGLGYWGTMFTAGATWFPDAERTWSVSLLNRYEINARQRKTRITPGDAWTLEWGVGKAIIPTVELGLAGYYQQQTTRDRGRGASRDRDRVAAVGPEVVLVFPAQRLFVSLRYAWEFWAESRAQGHTGVVTLTHRF
jgi:hypothetical protein